MMVQISTSVQQTMEDVVLKPAVVTLWVVSHVAVTMDSWEMDLLVLVSWINIMNVLSHNTSDVKNFRNVALPDTILTT